MPHDLRTHETPVLLVAALVIAATAILLSVFVDPRDDSLGIGGSNQLQQIASNRTSDAQSRRKLNVDLEKDSHLSRNDREVVIWFDSLGFPDLTDRKLVRVSTGTSRVDDNGELQSRTILAFLLSERTEDFTVFTLDLFTRSYSKTTGDVPKPKQVRFDVLNLRQEAADQLDQLRNPGDEDYGWGRFGETVSERTEVFVWARGCVGNRLTQLAHDFIAHAASIPNPQTGERVRVDGLAAVLSNEIGDSMLWRNVLALGDSKVPRAQLLKRFQDFTNRFPKSRYAERATRTANLLKLMVKEDAAHARKKLKALHKMTTGERVAELIFQLRDQNGKQISHPGRCNIFLDSRDGGCWGASLAPERTGASPACHLVRIGHDAIPQLIEHLDDHRLTRSIGFHRYFYFSHHALRVGDCALAIIERIAGQSFYNRRTTNSEMLKDGKSGSAKSRVKKWWSNFKKKDENRKTSLRQRLPTELAKKAGQAAGFEVRFQVVL